MKLALFAQAAGNTQLVHESTRKIITRSLQKRRAHCLPIPGEHFLDLNMLLNGSLLDLSERRDHEHMNEKETQLSPRNRVAMTVI